MNPDVFVGPLIAAAVVIGGGLIAHAVMDAYKQGRMERDIESLWDQMGRDSESGMRKTVHDARNIGSVNTGTNLQLADRVERIERVLNGKLHE